MHVRHRIVKIHYIGEWIPKRSRKNRRFGGFEQMRAFLRKTKATSVFISMMRMIFIFGFAKIYLLGKKLRRFYDTI